MLKKYENELFLLFFTLLILGIGFTSNTTSALANMDKVPAYPPSYPTPYPTAYPPASAPVVLSIQDLSLNPSSASIVDFLILFSDEVSGVDTSDFSLTVSGISDAHLQGITGSGDTYTVSVNTGFGSGTIRLDLLDDNSITDTNGRGLGGTLIGDGNFTNGAVYTINAVPFTGEVSGSGWLNTQAGWCSLNSACASEGKTKFEFKVKADKKGLSGKLELEAKDFHFQSNTAPAGLSLREMTTQFTGRGTIEGKKAPNGDYFYKVWASDASPDQIQIRIWWIDIFGREKTVFDTNSAQTPGNGNIRIKNK